MATNFVENSYKPGNKHIFSVSKNPGARLHTQSQNIRVLWLVQIILVGDIGTCVSNLPGVIT